MGSILLLKSMDFLDSLEKEEKSNVIEQTILDLKKEDLDSIFFSVKKIY